MKYLTRKIISLFLSVVLIVLLTFLAFQVLPGDPARAMLGVEADEAQVAVLRAKINYQPDLGLRFTNWVEDIITGNLGDSYRYSQPVGHLVLAAGRVSFSLAALSMVIAVVFGILLGVILARTNKSKLMLPLSMLSQLGFAIPHFCLAIFLIIIFTNWLGVLPSIGFRADLGFWDNLSYLVLPALALATGLTAIIARYLRSGLIKESNQAYVMTARSKGLSDSYILWHHQFKNALLPLITILGMLLADLLGGSIIIENIFNIPGIGNLLVTAISSRDLPLISGLIIYLSLVVVCLNFCVDIIYSLVDPRIALQKEPRYE